MVEVHPTCACRKGCPMSEGATVAAKVAAKASDKAPAFQLYVKDYETDEHVKLMSLAQEGAYLRLLCHQWINRSIPDDPALLARICRVSEREFKRLWPGLEPCFPTVAAGRRANPRLERQRTEQDDFSSTQSTNGKAGAAARWGRRPHGEATSGANGAATESPQANDSSPSPTASPSAIPFATARARGVYDGALPRDHVTHIACDETFSRCVPIAVHRKLANALAPRHDGDREAAGKALLAWYPTVWQTLPADAVMGDAFTFWQRHFDAAFATAAPRSSANEPRQVVPSAAETDAYLRELRGGEKKPA